MMSGVGLDDVIFTGKAFPVTLFNMFCVLHAVQHSSKTQERKREKKTDICK